MSTNTETKQVYLEDDIKRIFDGKRVLIAGMGREGKSALALLERLAVCGEIVTAENDEAIRAALSESKFDMVVKSPGVPMRVLRDLCQKTEITSMTDVFLRVYGDQVVGVTGTKGKSTTASLIYNVFKTAGYKVLLGGNIGIPLFELLEQMDVATIVVAELSCHQLEGIHRGPHVAVLLNLFQEHLDHYGSYLEYKMAKLQIGLRQCDGDTFIYCRDNDELCATVRSQQSAFRSQMIAYSADDEPLFGEVATRLPGEHNRSNIQAVAYVAQQYCIDPAMFRKGVSEFNGLEHRLEYVGISKGIKFYNDSISTIPAACEAAVKSIGDVQTLILGGFDRKIDYSGLACFLSKSGVSNIAFVGEAGKRILAELERLYPEHGKTMFVVGGNAKSGAADGEEIFRRVVAWCFAVTEAGKSCLLSPAAASYDSFRNFEERGRVFKDLVRSHLRHELHTHPGLSGNEAFAHDLIVDSLKAYNDCTVFTYVGGNESAGDVLSAGETPASQFFGRVSGYGVVAVFGDRKGLPTIALRADTDALPIDETALHAACAPKPDNAPQPAAVFDLSEDFDTSGISDFSDASDYSSQVRGVSHKCGHDGHTAIMLRVADLIAQNPDVYAKKNIMLIFQPEEETGYGSQKILDSGIMQRYDIQAVYGLHNIPGEPLGLILLSDNTFAAASAGVKYCITGRQTHASTPEKGLNPGMAVAEMIERFNDLNSNLKKQNTPSEQGTRNLQSILTPWKNKSRNTPVVPFDPIADFTQSTLIGVTLGEEAYGTSAGTAEVMFTLRAFSNSSMAALRKKADGIAAEVCSKYGLRLSVRESDPFKATENNAELVNQLEKTLTASGYAVRHLDKPFRWSEDFANYLLHYRGAFFGIGAGEHCPELHHPDYDFPDALIEPAAKAFYEIILSFDTSI